MSKKEENSQEKTTRKRYEPHVYEPANPHVIAFFMFMASVVFEILRTPTAQPFWRVLILCGYLMFFPLCFMYIEFYEMCERRRFIERFFPETYWSD